MYPLNEQNNGRTMTMKSVPLVNSNPVPQHRHQCVRNRSRSRSRSRRIVVASSISISYLLSLMLLTKTSALALTIDPSPHRTQWSSSTLHYKNQRRILYPSCHPTSFQRIRHPHQYRTTAIHSSPSYDYPQQDEYYNEDPELEWEDYANNNNDNNGNTNDGFDRRNFKRVGISSRDGIASDRQKRAMMLMNANNEDDDQWGDYMDVGSNSVNGDGGGDIGDVVADRKNGRMESNGNVPRKVLREPFIVNDTPQRREQIKNGMGGASSRENHRIRTTTKLRDDSIINNNERNDNVHNSPRKNNPSIHTKPAQQSRGDDDDTTIIAHPPTTVQSKKATPPAQSSSSPSNNNSKQRTRIPTEVIHQIKSTISLTAAIESYNLPSFTRISSTNARACCPFHDDTNPSLNIDDGKGLYKCFSCGAGGDVFNFIREYDLLDGTSGGNGGSGEKKKMGYMAAVEYAAREFGDGDLVKDWNYISGGFGSGGGSGSGEFEGMSEEAMEKIRERERKKDRIRQANTAAAAFYTKCLVTLPTAGKARVHLRSRYISPESIRTFNLGYAPDCYYGDEKPSHSAAVRATSSSSSAGTTKSKSKGTLEKKKATWGSGSLVEFLADAGFTPDEIVEAGLAVRTKKKQSIFISDIKKKNGDNNELSSGKNFGKEFSDDKEDNEEEQQQHDYSDLMDRFRSRLIVPILDERGQNVIALGGRHLESNIASSATTVSTDDNAKNNAKNDNNNEKEKKFTPAKYINSPDSLVFTKKNVLYNRHLAKRALDEISVNKGKNRVSVATKMDEEKKDPITFDAPPAVVIVEGYFDAIALANVGVKNVVASMGTALPLEQLRIAAEMGNVPGGRIILCMDGDDAGQIAVERLCSSLNSNLSKIPDLNRNELYVAALPSETKDPSDYVDFAGGDTKARDQFQREILAESTPWDEWYVARLLSKHDPNAKDGTRGSFSDVCEEVSTFLSTFSNPADRTRRAYEIAELLVELIAVGDNDNEKRSSSSLGMLRVQLESDILNMSSRKAGVREAMERRIERADGLSEEAAASKMERLSSGEGSALGVGDIDDRKMSKNALARAKKPQPGTENGAPRQIPASRRPIAQPEATRSFRAAARKSRQPRQLKLPERQLVPHFDGFKFKHQSDRDWLGYSDDGKRKPKTYLGDTPSPSDLEAKDRLRAETPVFETEYNPARKKDNAVYFNSNRYLGQQYLSADAMRVGYTLDENDVTNPNESIVDFTERKIFEHGDPDRLIPQAESRLLHALAKFPRARAAMRTVYSTSTFGPTNLRWTSAEREWLFSCLTGSAEVEPPLSAELLDEGTPEQLRSYLAERDDCPENAFDEDFVFESAMGGDATSEGVIETVESSITDVLGDEPGENSNGNPEVEVIRTEEDELDSFIEPPPHSQTSTDSEIAAENGRSAPNGLFEEYFLENPDMFPSFSNSIIAEETRAELTVQETVATLLCATAKKRFAIAKSKLTNIVSEMDRRLNDDADNREDGNELAANGFEDVSSDELQELFKTVGTEVLDAQKSLYESERSTDRVNSHLLDYTVSNGVQYKQSQAGLERLDKMMEDHIASLPEDSHRPETRGDDGTYVFGSDDFDDAIDPMFGGRNPDEYVVRGLPDGESKFE